MMSVAFRVGTHDLREAGVMADDVLPRAVEVVRHDSEEVDRAEIMFHSNSCTRFETIVKEMKTAFKHRLVRAVLTRVHHSLSESCYIVARIDLLLARCNSRRNQLATAGRFQFL